MKLSLYLSLLYRLTLVFVLFSICRILFFLLNTSLYPDIDMSYLLSLFYVGLRFDLTAILYTNALFILASILPFRFRSHITYQKCLAYLFYFFNSLALMLNLIDIVYFKFTLRRTTWSVCTEFAHDFTNTALWAEFALDFWFIPLLLIVLICLMVYLYKKVEVNPSKLNAKWFYPINIVLMAVTGGLFIGGVRGGFDYSTRPITISNAAAYVKQPVDIGIVLNTPFSIFRTLERTGLKPLTYFESSELSDLYNPIHQPNLSIPFTKKNIVILIVESLSKEYIGVYNKDLDGGTYKGYTPFIDSLVGVSYSFDQSFANGSKSIDAMPSILASIPSLVDPYVLSIYSNNNIQGLASLLGKKGYSCSFFHGAPDGSMGFDAFAKISGFDHYYGKTAYGNDADFDGRWGIWDEPFLQFFARSLNHHTQPFLGVLFSTTSHHPFVIPPAYANRFPKGVEEIHQCIGYTDFALKRFFDSARNMPWFNNTLFVLTADHTNQATHDRSKTAHGRFQIPIVIYDPTGALQGRSSKICQQIDIMPTLLNYLGYPDPYFAFGFDALDSTSNAFAINHNGFFQLIKDQYLLQSDNEKPVALFNYQQDELLQNKLSDTQTEQQLDTLTKAFRQVYYQSLIDNKMTVTNQ